ncbi:hypothetical protein MKK75_16615 [Methylobacterium sp. J-030]|uniref:hypothetical protein n=1 Tax=Methylobacterium sp. J-030 TaxID=2836627 RepID=UPI001FB9E3CA|nr:hypothetical protein [Methylobacterium sp. J-030]MCJ2070402.1 hypothetical protein [Methylobacterium sp. J-030]
MHSLPTHMVEIVPCEDGYRWIIRARGGAVVESSPYAFMSSNGARISGECWKREHFTDSQSD